MAVGGRPRVAWHHHTRIDLIPSLRVGDLPDVVTDIDGEYGMHPAGLLVGCRSGQIHLPPATLGAHEN